MVIIALPPPAPPIATRPRDDDDIAPSSSGVIGRGTTSSWTYGDGWKSLFGSNRESIALYRIFLGIVLSVELMTRFNYLHPFYTDEG